MAKVGRKVVFHGSFTHKACAKRKERKIPGSYVTRRRVKGQGIRYLVQTRRRRR